MTTTTPIDLRLEAKLMLGRDARRAMASSIIRMTGTTSVPRDTTSLFMRQIAGQDEHAKLGEILPMDYFLRDECQKK